MKQLILILCSASLALALDAAQAGISATLEPSQVSVGEPAELTITTDGSGSAEPSIPSIPGLEIAHVGQSTQIQVINGSFTASTVQTYEVTPQRAGTFTIPAISGGGARTRPLTLRVGGGGGGGANPSSGSGALPPPNVSTPAAADAAPSDSRFGFIQFAVPKKDLYVGELVPVDINVFVPGGANVTELPTLTSDAVTMNSLSNKPEREERIMNRNEYTVFTWHSAITTVKPGDFTLSMRMPLTVIVREQPQRRQRSGNDLFDQFFNDPFFNDSFARRVRKEVTLSSEPAEVTVQALPKAGRPTNFSGTIGHFDLRASATPTQVAAGDPVTLRLELSGSGDFDRAASEMLASGNGWKTYPPKSSFQPEDSAGYQGTKTFEQLIIPENGSVREIPALRFSFFDPKTRQYETRMTAPIPISVTGAPAVAAAPAPATNVPVASAPPTVSAAPTPAPLDLVPNKVDAGPFVASLRPIFVQPWFVAAPGLPLFALAGGLLLLRRKRRFEADPRFARATAADRAIHALLDRMDQAMRQHASAEFFLSARGALQQRLGERWNVRPETITLGDIQARLNGAGDGIRPIFEMADQVSYSGQQLGDADYRRWKELVVAQLKELEKQPV